jgi:hypothetical protein
MSLEEQANSWALSLFDTLESQSHRRTRILTAIGGAAVTLIVWIAHLLNPEIFASVFENKGWAKLFLGFLLAPPFVLAFTIGSFIYPQPIQPRSADEVGSMSTYFYQDRSSRRWKLVIGAALVAAVNFVLMLITSGV